MRVLFSKPATVTSGTIILIVAEGGKLGQRAGLLDKHNNGAISRGIKASSFKGKQNQSLRILAPGSGKLEQLILMGAGKIKELDKKVAENMGGEAFAALSAGIAKSACVFLVHHATRDQLPCFQFYAY